ncbi:MAG: hypothetical protein ACI39U_07450 [Candidatus Cryptobacteroides sp.]
MNIQPKEQTAFRFDVEMIAMMKRRSKALGKSMNAYVTDLIMRDIRESCCLPKVRLSQDYDETVEKFAGIMACPSVEELDNDERLARIWKR